MHFPSILIALSLSATSLAAAIPGTEPPKAKVAEYGWHGCAAGVYCTSDSDCRSEDACLSTSGNIVENIHCGQHNYPFSCWAEWTT